MMKSRRAVKAAATCRRYLRTGGALAVMAGIYAVMTGFSFWPEKAGSKPNVGKLGAPSESAAPPLKRVAGQVDRRGHCYFDTVVNGNVHLRMMFDTGATNILVYSEHLARLRVPPSTLHYERRVSTVSGKAYVAPLTLHEVRIGDYVMHDVPGAVMKSSGDRDDDEPLLGLPILKDARVELGSGTCTLLWR
jgi:clan AA aspartic protease (TIGR02281 family)